MRISNGNFLDEDGHEVNLVKLLRTGKATPVVNNNDGHHMSAHSGWFTDENGTPVNIVALIDAAIDEDGGDDEPPIGGISINVVPTDTASGAIATFNDGADDIPVKNLTVNIKPIQDLHGYDNPWSAGGGINIWDEEWEQGRIGNGANSTNAAGFRSKNKIKINPNTTYYLHVGSGDYGNFWVSYYNENEVYIPTSNPSGYSTLEKNSEFTTPENAYYMRFFLSVATEYKNDISINYPSANTDYYPYSNICPISGWTSAKVTRTGKNLFDESILLLASGWTVTNGVYSGSNFALHTAFLVGLPNLKSKPNTQYTVSLKFRSEQESKLTVLSVVYTDGTKTSQYLKGTSEYTVSLTSTSGKSVEKITLSYGNTDTVYIYDMQVEEGSTATDYEPYKGESYAVDWSDEAGTVYGGKLDMLTGVLTVDRAIVDLGTLAWSYITTQGRNYFLAAISNRLNNSEMVCSMYPWKGNSTDSSMGTRDDATLWDDSGGSAIKIKDSSYTGAKLFKTAMNGVHLCYELAEPQTYQLTQQEVKTILGENNIFADTGDVSVEYRADIKKYIDKVVATAVSALS